MNTSTYFDVAKVSRLIALGHPTEEIVPFFEPLIRTIINRSVAFDHRNHSEEDLIQIGLVKSMEVIERFRPDMGNLFSYAAKLIRHALWSEVKLKPLDAKRITDEVDFDTLADVPRATHSALPELALSDKFMAQLRLGPETEPAVKYVFGVLTANDYESNRARVLKTLTYGFDINPKQARFLTDHVLVHLRANYSKGVKEVRDDEMFEIKYRNTLVPELRQLLGERSFEKLIHYFGGLSISIPSLDQINSIDRDLAILKALAQDWTCGPELSKKYGISPEGIKAVYKNCLHKLHTDQDYKRLVGAVIPLNTIPGYEDEKSPKAKKIVSFGEKKHPMRRRSIHTDSMGFSISSRNSLLYTQIVTGRCTRAQLVQSLVTKFGGTESAAKATVSAFLSDLKHPFGKFNTSRNLKVIVDPQGRLSFESDSLVKAQHVIAVKRQNQMMDELETEVIQ
jgi:RNA polymerase sigma factor (sigma-70 family)